MSNPNPAQDLSFDTQPVQQDTHVPAAGLTFDSEPVQQDTHVPSSTTSTASVSATPFEEQIGSQELFHHDPNEGFFTHALKDAGNLVQGAGQGVASTVAGVADAYRKANSVDEATGNNPIADAISKHAHILAGDHMQDRSGASAAGYGGETLAEFMLGDEALKSLSLADRLSAVSKSMKILEKSPRLVQALKVGAEAARAGAVQGTQTLLRTGDPGEALKTGLETAGTTGVLGGVTHAAGAVASKLGKAGTTAGELAETAASAPDKQTVAQNIQGRLIQSENDLHQNYENQTNNFHSRLQGSTIPAADAPIADKAQDILAKPDPEDHPFVQQAAEANGEKLDKPVRSLLENIANGKVPLTQEDIDAADTANKNKPTILDASGKAIETPDVEPEAADAPDLDSHAVIDLRQKIRALASNYEPGDINARALKRLLWDSSDHSSAFDDTFENLAQQSSDPTVGADYKALRDDYRSKISLYDDPVIKNLMQGKVDDAAKAFVGTKSASGLPTAGKTAFNTNNLRTLVGEQGLNAFRNDVFTNMLKESSDSNGFNPAKFTDTWKKVASGTQDDFFSVDDPSIHPQTLITSLSQDAKSAASVQKLTRAGLLLAGSGVAGAANYVLPATAAAYADGGLTAALAVAAHGKGLNGAKELLDYVANNPKTWAFWRGVGKFAESPRAASVARNVTRTGQAAVNLNATSNEEDQKAAAYRQAQSALSGSPDTSGYSHVSDDGKYGWDGTKWVPISQ